MKNKQTNKIEIGAVYRVCNTGEGFRFYRLTSHELGALGQENIIGLEALDKSKNGDIRVPKSVFNALFSMGGIAKVSGTP